jgi:hypothetical protein
MLKADLRGGISPGNPKAAACKSTVKKGAADPMSWLRTEGRHYNPQMNLAADLLQIAQTVKDSSIRDCSEQPPPRILAPYPHPFRHARESVVSRNIGVTALRCGKLSNGCSGGWPTVARRSSSR